MDAIAWGCVLGALAATGVAALGAARGRTGLALAFVIASGLLLRTNLAWRRWLSDWDERFHAVVARNLMEHPLHPMLIPIPFDEQPFEAWTHAHVWLHKPPLATWLMAGSMEVFGESEIAVRLPSLLFAALGIGLTFWLGRRFFGTHAGLLAALLHAWHGRLALFAGGLRATDHVDHQLVVLVELAACLGILAADRLGTDTRLRRGLVLAALCGVATGAAWLTKSTPGLVGLGVLGLALLAAPLRWPVRIGAAALAGAVALAAALPWELHVRAAYPDLAAFYAARNARHFSEVVDGQGGPAWYYVRDMGKMFGAFAPLAVAVMLVRALGRREMVPLWGWLVAVYAAFSLAATKMTGYVFVAAPVVFCLLAGAWTESWNARRSHATVAYRLVALLALVSFLLGSAWRVHRPWRAPPRDELWAQELRFLGDAVATLGEGRWLVFNTPNATEALFYLRATPVGRPPRGDDLARAEAGGFRVAVYDDPGAKRLAKLRDHPAITWLDPDPRTRDARALLRALPRGKKSREIQIWNARDARAMESYLERQREVDVHTRRPAELVATDEPQVLLLASDEPAPTPLPPGWFVVRSDAFAASARP